MRDGRTDGNFLERNLWAALVLLLVVGGMVAAIARPESSARASSIQLNGATLAGDATPWALRLPERP